MSQTGRTPEFRASYPKVFAPELNKLNNTEEYSVVALFPKGQDLSELKKMGTAAIEEKWGKDPSKWPKNLRSPFRKQEEKGKDVDGKFVLPDGHEEGAIFMTFKTAAKNGNKPEIYDMDGKRTHDTSKIYAGCWCWAVVNARAYEKAGNCGVNFYLVGLQKRKDGPPLAGKVNPEQFFEPVAGSASASSGAGGLFD